MLSVENGLVALLTVIVSATLIYALLRSSASEPGASDQTHRRN